MNEQFKALIVQAIKEVGPNDTDRGPKEKTLQRFAELIVEACVEECEKKNPHPDQWSDEFEYTEKRMALGCAQAIKDRFNL